jgi:hypothetical protein
MNIFVVREESGDFIIRPDSTLNRGGEDYYCPSEISEIETRHIIFLRIDKLGKSILRKFSHRYYSLIGYGITISACTDNISWKYSEPARSMIANYLDDTTVVSDTVPLNKFAPFEENAEKRERFLEYADTKIEEISALTSVKSGDLIAFETGDAVRIKRCADPTHIAWKNLNFNIIW